MRTTTNRAEKNESKQNAIIILPICTFVPCTKTTVLFYLFHHECDAHSRSTHHLCKQESPIQRNWWNRNDKIQNNRFNIEFCFAFCMTNFRHTNDKKQHTIDKILTYVLFFSSFNDNMEFGAVNPLRFVFIQLNSNCFPCTFFRRWITNRFLHFA